MAVIDGRKQGQGPLSPPELQGPKGSERPSQRPSALVPHLAVPDPIGPIGAPGPNVDDVITIRRTVGDSFSNKQGVVPGHQSPDVAQEAPVSAAALGGKEGKPGKAKGVVFSTYSFVSRRSSSRSTMRPWTTVSRLGGCRCGCSGRHTKLCSGRALLPSVASWSFCAASRTGCSDTSVREGGFDAPAFPFTTLNASNQAYFDSFLVEYRTKIFRFAVFSLPYAPVGPQPGRCGCHRKVVGGGRRGRGSRPPQGRGLPLQRGHAHVARIPRLRRLPRQGGHGECRIPRA